MWDIVAVWDARMESRTSRKKTLSSWILFAIIFSHKIVEFLFLFFIQLSVIASMDELFVLVKN